MGVSAAAMIECLQLLCGSVCRCREGVSAASVGVSPREIVGTAAAVIEIVKESLLLR